MPAWLSFLNNIDFTLTTFFWFCLLLGAALVILSLVFGEILDFAFHADAGGPFSGPVIASFIVVFGGSGLVFHEVMHLSPLPSTFAAGVSSIMVSTVVYFVFAKFILAAEGGTTYDPTKTAGTEAEVIITIPANGTGEITFDHSSGRISGGARSRDGEEIPNGSLVKIDRYIGGTYIVAPNSKPKDRQEVSSSTKQESEADG